MTVAAGARYNSDNGSESGHARILTYDSITNRWNTLGNAITGVAPGDQFGRSVSLSADGKTVAVGATGNDDNGISSGHVKILVYSSTENKWNSAGDTIAGVAMYNSFGQSVSISSNGKTVAAGAPSNDDNGTNSGHVRILRYKNIILAKEHGWCANPFGTTQENGKVELSTDNFGPSIEK